jgi:hypothetical protein
MRSTGRIVLTDMNGFKIFQSLKKSSGVQNVPVVMMQGGCAIIVSGGAVEAAIKADFLGAKSAANAAANFALLRSKSRPAVAVSAGPVRSVQDSLEAMTLTLPGPKQKRLCRQALRPSDRCRPP